MAAAYIAYNGSAMSIMNMIKYNMATCNNRLQNVGGNRRSRRKSIQLKSCNIYN